MRGRKIALLVLCLLLALAIVPMAVGAEIQEKSWNDDNTMLFQLRFDNHTDSFSLQPSEDSCVLGRVAAGNGLEEGDPLCSYDEMYGEWSLNLISGDKMDVEIYQGDHSTYWNDIIVNRAVEGQSATYQIVYKTTDDSPIKLQNPLAITFSVEVLPSDAFPQDCVYESTTINAKTGEYAYVDAPTMLPEGTQAVGFSFDASEIWDAGDIGYFDGWNDGSFGFMITQPGAYHVTAFAALAENNVKEIPLTLNVTGAPAEWELPKLAIHADQEELNRVENDWDDIGVWIGIEDNFGRWNDELEWSVDLIKGNADTFEYYYLSDAEDFGGDVYYGNLRVIGTIPAGSYQFKVTLTDKTRDESADCVVTMNVEQKPDSININDIRYKKFAGGDTVTIKAGDTLSFGKPQLTLTPSKAKMPADTHYGMWCEEDLGDEQLRSAMFVEDPKSGAHKIVGLKEGTYTVHAWVDCYGGSRGNEMIFTLKVEPKGEQAQSISLNVQGDEEHPYKLEIGSKLKLKATVGPKSAKNKKVTWVSENPDGFSVDSKGVVKVKNAEAGWCGYIYAYTTDGSNLCASVFVEAVDPKVTKITLSKKKLTMKVGDEKTLTAKLKPQIQAGEPPVWWVSDNAEVAQVDGNGTIQAVKPGKATIYGYFYDWQTNTMVKNVFGKCVVTVK